jgi:hypothetical protein
MDDNWPVISEYRDDHGVLVSVPGEGKVNRVTRAVFDHFTKPMRGSSAPGARFAALSGDRGKQRWNVFVRDVCE